MQERLLRYYSKHCGLFVYNFRHALTGFDEEAVHDMRVAVKRIRAVNLLIERLFPGKFDSVTCEGQIRELFRLSGRIRDTQVQQLLLSDCTEQAGTTLGEYQHYLKKTEQKSIRRFNKCLAETDAEADLEDMQKLATDLIKASTTEGIARQIILFIDELMAVSRSMRQDQAHDENLHEIRKKLKNCHYLLTLFDKDDPDLPKLSSTIKRLDKVNELLGEWHDQVVAMEMLGKFISQRGEAEITGDDYYRQLMDNLSGKRQQLHEKIMNYFEEKLDL